jgi:hypothetical protein
MMRFDSLGRVMTLGYGLRPFMMRSLSRMRYDHSEMGPDHSWCVHSLGRVTTTRRWVPTIHGAFTLSDALRPLGDGCRPLTSNRDKTGDVSSPKPELAAALRSLTDLLNLLETTAHAMRGLEGREQQAGELLAIEAALRSGERRLEKLVGRL